jgi:hypothetical protein
MNENESSIERVRADRFGWMPADKLAWFLLISAEASKL